MNLRTKPVPIVAFSVLAPVTIFIGLRSWWPRVAAMTASATATATEVSATDLTAGLLRAGLDPQLVLGIILLTATVNLLIGSASAKWALLAPIFVPMLMLSGFSPESAQAAYRVGDSFANIVSPLLPYLPLIIVFARRYDREAGIGTLLAAMLPYALSFGVVWTALLLGWLALGIPLGPGAPTLYP